MSDGPFDGNLDGDEAHPMGDHPEFPEESKDDNSPGLGFAENEVRDDELSGIPSAGELEEMNSSNGYNK